MTRVAILAFLLLMAPALAGKTDLVKTPACVPGAAVKMVQVEPDLLVIGRPVNVFFAQAQARKLLKELRAKEPCELKGRVRSPSDLKCYFPKRLP